MAVTIHIYCHYIFTVDFLTTWDSWFICWQGHPSVDFIHNPIQIYWPAIHFDTWHAITYWYESFLHRSRNVNIACCMFVSIAGQIIRWNGYLRSLNDQLKCEYCGQAVFWDRMVFFTAGESDLAFLFLQLTCWSTRDSVICWQQSILYESSEVGHGHIVGKDISTDLQLRLLSSTPTFPPIFSRIASLLSKVHYCVTIE